MEKTNTNGTTHAIFQLTSEEAYPYPLIPKVETPQNPAGTRKKAYKALNKNKILFNMLPEE